MKVITTPLLRPTLRGLVLALAVTALASYVAHATPYASQVTVSSGTVTFWLNEANATVTVTYEDGTTNATFNGSVVATAGSKSFSLGAHTSYTITAYTAGAGAPANIVPLANAPIQANYRGLDVNKNPKSKYFGRVYVVKACSNTRFSSSWGGIFSYNPDLSQNQYMQRVQTAQNAWDATTPNYSPNMIWVAPDDWLLVADLSPNTSTVWRFPASLSGTYYNLFAGIGPITDVRGTTESRPILTGLGGPSTNLYFIDGDFPAATPNSTLVYSNIPPDWSATTTSPSATNEVGPAYSDQTYHNIRGQLSLGPNGWFYVSLYAADQQGNPWAAVQVYDSTATNLLWTSTNTAPAGTDWFINAAPGGSTWGVVDSAVSADGRYLAAINYDNHFTVVGLTNGIPDVSTLLIFANARGIGGSYANYMAWDAADNLYTASPVWAYVDDYTLGLQATAVTIGDSTGSTNFQLVLPSSLVTVAAVAPAIASQANGYGNPTSATFTLSRSGTVSSPLTVNFSLGGTAAGGTYTASKTTTVTFAAGQSTTNVTIAAVTDSVPRPTATVVLTVLSGSGYGPGAPASATISIINTAPDKLVISPTAFTSMYKPFANDYATFSVARWGDTNAAAFTIPSTAYTNGGTAVAGTDYYIVSSVTFNPGDTAQTVTVSPLINGATPVHDNLNAYTGDKTIIIGLTNQTGVYTAASSNATLTIVDNAYPPATVLYANPLTDPNDATNWNITFGNSDQNNPNYTTDYEALFGFDLTAGTYGVIPSPPNGATTALRLTCNKDFNLGHTTFAGAVNAYPTNWSLNGDYAVRFSMNLIQCAGGRAEGSIFGINHGGADANWFLGAGTITSGGPWPSDGIWYWIDSTPTGTSGFTGYPTYGDFAEITGPGTHGTTVLQQKIYSGFTNVFKSPVPYSVNYYGDSGVPANGSSTAGTYDDSTWSDVEIKQVQGVVTMSVNHTPVFVYTNSTAYTSGYPMLGYECALQSANNPEGAAYFSDLKVVSLAVPAVRITSIQLSGGNVVISFTSGIAGDTTSSFTVAHSGTVNGTYADVSPAAVITGSAGSFQATFAKSGSAQFYRIHHPGS